MEYFIQSPPEFPNPHAEPSRQVFPPVPVIYEKSATQVEYRVLARQPEAADKLESELNELGREGWWLAATVPGEKRVLLIFMRQTRR